MNARGTSSAWLRGTIFILLLAGLAAAAFWYIKRPQREAVFALAQSGFDAIPGWRAGDDRAALSAFRLSCSRILALPAGTRMGPAYAGLARDWQTVCRRVPSVTTSDNARRWFESFFVPFALSANGNRAALLTGYYEPEIRASRTRHTVYATPVYGLPTDLVVADLGLFHANLAGLRISGRVEGRQLVPFPTRETIDEEGLNDAPVLLYANDPVALFFLHMQGSGRALLDTGEMVRLAYAGQNGRAYTPIGRVLIERGEVDRRHLSMQAIRSWLAAHPASARTLMESDESYVFFRELPLGDPILGSPGTEGVPLTPGASIAVDPQFHAFGAPVFVSAEQNSAPGNPLLLRLCIAQDTGGAIKGSLRADVFWGFGARAEQIAGGLKARGKLFVLLPKALAGHLGGAFQETS